MAQTILLVEDDATLAEMYELKLTGAGFTVWRALNGSEALEVLTKNGAPALMLLDVMMPVMDGFQLLERLKADEKWKEIPVVMLTNLGQGEDMERGKKLGAVDYIVKANVTPAEVVEKVKALLDDANPRM